MEWLKELQGKYRSGVAHQFLLYLNIKDIFLNEKNGKKFQRLDDFLCSSEPLNKAGIVIIYNRGTGLRFPKKEHGRDFLKLLGFDEGAGVEEIPVAPDKIFPLLNVLLHYSWSDAEVIEKLGEDRAKKMRGKPLVGLVIEYPETLVPPDAASSSVTDDRNLVVLFQRWAHDQKIRESRNLVLLVTESLVSLAPSLRAPSSEITILKIPFPDLAERIEAIEVLRQTYPRKDEDVDDRSFAHLTAGLNRLGIQLILQDAHHHQKILNPGEVFNLKKRILEEQSGGLIEIKRPMWGMEAIGDLKPHKAYIQKIVVAMGKNDPLIVPMGILLIGPPGTGKTVFAEALAYEADIPLVILKNIREMWVGQSERNQDLVFELIKALAPVIVFQDEIDQQIQMRGAVFHGDSGVSARMAGQQYAFMSDTSLRGKVVWLAATNRPDLLDPAMLRPGRFDEKIPFLPPDEEGRVDIIFALLRKMEIQARITQSPFGWELSEKDAKEIAKKARCFWKRDTGEFRKELRDYDDPENYTEVSFTGAEIEVILRKAYTKAREKGKELLTKEYVEEALTDYLPTKDLIIYNEMASLALMEADSEQFLTDEKWRKEARRVRSGIKRKREEPI